MKPLSKLGIVGSGTMGTSIAVAISKLKIPILIIDKDLGALEKGLKNIDQIFARLEKKEENSGIKNDLQTRRSLIKAATTYDAFKEIDFVIEAANENLEIKKSVFQDLEKHCPPQTIFASNTSSLSITQLASFTNRQDKFIGMHFFNPAHIMRLVEIIPGLNTAAQTVKISMTLAQAADKFPVQVQECASFLVNRLLTKYLNEAIWALQLNLASVEEIDNSACQILMPIGPLQLRDMNGLDIGLSVAQFNFEEYGERFKPPPLLALMVDKKFLGKKSGAGFYLYNEQERKPQGINIEVKKLVTLLSAREKISPDLPKFEPMQLFLPMINEAFFLLQEKIVESADIDPALQAGLGMKQGLLDFTFQYGLGKCLDSLEKLNKYYGERFRPAPLLKRYVWAGKKSLH